MTLKKKKKKGSQVTSAVVGVGRLSDLGLVLLGKQSLSSSVLWTHVCVPCSPNTYVVNPV